MRITITDVRRVYCVDGARRWAAENGLDFKDFIRNGIEVETLRSRVSVESEALIERVMTAKMEAENGQRRR